MEIVTIGVIALVLAFSANHLRAGAAGHLKIAKNYFDKTIPPEVLKDASKSQRSDGAGGVATQAKHSATGESKEGEPGHMDHEFQDITFDEVATLFGGVKADENFVLFVDARNDDAFRAGRIPGAVQCDRYNLEAQIQPVLARADTAGKIVVYCNGGDCEDSIYLCKEFLDFDLRYDKIYLFAGGWKEWTKNNMPFDKDE